MGKSMTEHAFEVRELQSVRRRLGWLAEQRSTAGLSPTQAAEYGRLVAREEKLLRHVCDSSHG
jgi:hypothetical protein